MACRVNVSVGIGMEVRPGGPEIAELVSAGNVQGGDESGRKSCDLDGNRLPYEDTLGVELQHDGHRATS